jgi:microcystin-dependent protein
MPSYEDYLGSVGIVGFPWPMVNYALADGSLVSISQNTALFSLYGTYYGGNGQTTFALPDLRGRVAVGQGQGEGLSVYELGEETGYETTTLTNANVPPHAHPVSLGGTGTSGLASAANGTSTTAGTSTVLTGIAGEGLPFSNLQPLLAVNYVVTMYGIFPEHQ